MFRPGPTPCNRGSENGYDGATDMDTSSWIGEIHKTPASTLVRKGSPFGSKGSSWVCLVLGASAPAAFPTVPVDGDGARTRGGHTRKPGAGAGQAWTHYGHMGQLYGRQIQRSTSACR